MNIIIALLATNLFFMLLIFAKLYADKIGIDEYKEEITTIKPDFVESVDRKELKEVFEYIIRADKTSEYTYRGLDSKDRLGNSPKEGSKWLTPREVAEKALTEFGL